MREKERENCKSAHYPLPSLYAFRNNKYVPHVTFHMSHAHLSYGEMTGRVIGGVITVLGVGWGHVRGIGDMKGKRGTS